MKSHRSFDLIWDVDSGYYGAVMKILKIDTQNDGIGRSFILMQTIELWNVHSIISYD